MTSFFATGKVCTEKWEKLDKMLLSAGIGILMANDLANVRYLTGYLPYLTLSPGQGQLAVYVAGQGRPILYPISYYQSFARERFPWLEVRQLPAGDAAVAAEVAQLWSTRGAPQGRLGCTGLTPALDRALRQALPAGVLAEADTLLARARAVKTAGEIQLLLAAVETAAAGMQEARRYVAPGRTECEVAAEAERAMRRRGTESHALALRGPNAAILQEVATDDAFLLGDLALVDLGCYHGGYRAEFARTFPVGGSPGEAAPRGGGPATDALQVVLRALEAASQLLKPGASCGAIASQAYETIRAAGYGEYAHPHPVGHGLGVTGSEYPLFVPDSEVLLEPNMVVNLEPGIFIPEAGVGIRVEDTWLITRDGAELLTTAVPRTL